MTTPTPLPLDAAALEPMLRGTSFTVKSDDIPKLIAQSRAALTLAARVAELEGELAVTRKYADDCAEMLTRAVQERDATHIHANELRDALEKISKRVHTDGCDLPDLRAQNEFVYRTAYKALASTPAASLAAHDAEVLERARVALNDADADCECGNISAITTDNVIRALAAQAATHSVPGGTSEVKP